MPRPRREDAQDTRQLALGAALVLLHQYGYLGVSMDAVAKAIGVRKASLYHHFPGGKEQMILEIAERAIAEDRVGIASAIKAHTTARDRLTAVATHVFSGSVQTGRVLRDALRFMTQEHQDRIFTNFYQHYFLEVQAVMREGIESNELKNHDSERSAWAFWDLVSEMGTGGELPRDAALATWIVNLMIDGLRA